MAVFGLGLRVFGFWVHGVGAVSFQVLRYTSCLNKKNPKKCKTYKYKFSGFSMSTAMIPLVVTRVRG